MRQVLRSARKTHERIAVVCGAWHVPAGFAFLVRHPALWPLASLPTLLAAVGLALGALAAFYTLPGVESALVPRREQVGEILINARTLATDDDMASSEGGLGQHASRLGTGRLFTITDRRLRCHEV